MAAAATKRRTTKKRAGRKKKRTPSRTTLELGSRGREVKNLQLALAALGYHPGPADGDFGQRTRDAIAEFQAKHALLPDGIAGPITLRALNEELALLDVDTDVSSIKIVAPPRATLSSPAKLVPIVRCEADAIASSKDGTWDWRRDGQKSLRLRQDVAIAYDKVLGEVRSLGAKLSSAGGMRSLKAKVGAGRAALSMHYTGRAFDMATNKGMQNPNKDQHIIVRDPERERGWIVFGRSSSADVPKMTVDACYVVTRKNRSGRKYTQVLDKPITARLVNITELARKYGFRPISARSSFFSGGSYMGAEWWHFQYEKGLVPGKSTFGQALLDIYPKSKITKEFKNWSSAKHARFAMEWR